MGYDMRWVGSPTEAERAALAAATERFYAAAAVRDALPEAECGQMTHEEFMAGAPYPANASQRYQQAQAEVHRLFKELREAERSYFRLNINGMGRYREIMFDLGVLREDYDRAEQPEHPEDVPDRYWDWECEDESERRERGYTPGEVARFEQIERARQDWLSWSPPGPVTGIPVHKLCSNDGWVITPEECFVTAQTIRAMDPAKLTATLASHGVTDKEAVAYFHAWVRYLDEASQHGGFAVY